MCNCNQKRAMYTSENSSSKRGMVKVILKENNPMVINGSVTGRMYVFNKTNEVIWVDNRDAIALSDVTELQVIY